MALTAAAMWLVVTSTSRKTLEIGVLLGLWAIVIGASSAMGNRPHNTAPAPPAPSEPVAAPVTELDLRRKSAIERADDAAERRAFQSRLEEMVRAELRSGLAQEVAGLRTEVAGLRQEIVENLGGQLKLERIETTRRIGTDLQALHQAVRQLGVSAPNADTFTVTKAVPTPLPPPAGSPAPQTVDAEVVNEPAPNATTPNSPKLEVPSAVASSDEPGVAGSTANDWVSDADPFAAMPRLSSFLDLGGLPSDLAGQPVTGATAANGSAANGSAANGSAANGSAANGSAANRAAANESTANGAVRDRPTRSGRRHREDDSQNDTLARILERESQRSS